MKQHELRKWSCISLLLPVALGVEVGEGDGMGEDLTVTGSSRMSVCYWNTNASTRTRLPYVCSAGYEIYAHVLTPPRSCPSV